MAEARQVHLVRSRVAAALAILSLAVAACGEVRESGQGASGTTTPAARWDASEAPLPTGLRHVAYDNARDTIWILTRDRAGGPVTLTRFQPATGRLVTATVAAASRDYAGAGIDIDQAGAAWVAWGTVLRRFDPGTQRITSWDLPALSTDVQATDEDPSIGRVVSIAIDPTSQNVFVLRNKDRRLYRLSEANASWSIGGQLPIYPHQFTRVSILGDGTILVNGNTSDSVFAPALGIANTRDFRFRVIPDIMSFAEISSRRVVGAMQDGRVAVLDMATARLSPNIILPARPTSDIPIMADIVGNIWTWSYLRTGISILRVDTNSNNTASYPYPLLKAEPFTGLPVPPGVTPPTSASLDPDIQALVIDIHNRVWIISGWGGKSRPYPPLYRLIP